MYDPNDADTKAAVKAAVDAAIAEATTGLIEKNKELLGKLKKATKDVAIDPAEFQSLQAEKDALEAKLADATKAVKSATVEAEKHKKAYETESKVAHNLLVENGLTAALVEMKVKPELMEGAQELLRKNVVLVAEGENRIAKIGDKLLKDAVAEWAKSEKGKHYVAAPANQGGGAQGGAQGGGTAKTMTRTAFDILDATAKVEFSKSGGKLTD